MALTDKLTAIADAIRAKTGTTDGLTLDGMAEAVNGLEVGGGGFPNNITPVQLTLPSNSVVKEYDGRYIMTVDGRHKYTSNDGREWTTTDIHDNIAHRIAYMDDDIWFGHIYSTGGLCYSEDEGATWNNTNLTSSGSYTVTKAKHIWYAHNSSLPASYYSVDGKEWTQIDSNIGTVKYAKGVYISDPLGNGYVCRSEDGITWTIIDVFSEEKSYSVFWFKGRWFVHYFKLIYYSEDGGVSWTQITDNTVYIKASNASTLIGVDSADRSICFSSDGLTWNKTSLQVSSTDLYPSYYCGFWFAGDLHGHYSTDFGNTWHQLPIPDGRVGISNKLIYDGRTIMAKIRNSNYQNAWFYYAVFE